MTIGLFLPKRILVLRRLDPISSVLNVSFHFLLKQIQTFNSVTNCFLWYFIAKILSKILLQPQKTLWELEICCYQHLFSRERRCLLIIQINNVTAQWNICKYCQTSAALTDHCGLELIKLTKTGLDTTLPTHYKHKLNCHFTCHSSFIRVSANIYSWELLLTFIIIL